jgi:hypothetical protein
VRGCVFCSGGGNGALRDMQQWLHTLCQPLQPLQQVGTLRRIAAPRHTTPASLLCVTARGCRQPIAYTARLSNSVSVNTPFSPGSGRMAAGVSAKLKLDWAVCLHFTIVRALAGRSQVFSNTHRATEAP